MEEIPVAADMLFDENGDLKAGILEELKTAYANKDFVSEAEAERAKQTLESVEKYMADKNAVEDAIEQDVANFYDKVKSNMYSGYGYHGGGRTKGDINRKKVTAYIEENAFEKLSIFARKNNISPTKQVAKIIEDFVDKNL